MTNALAWRPTLHLPDADVRIADVVGPLTGHERWRATLDANLYLLAGTKPATQNPEEHELLAGYLGISLANSGRPWDSLTNWVRYQRALDLQTISLVTLRREHHQTADVLKVIEAATIRALNVTTFMINTVTGAPTPSKALGPVADQYAAYGEFLAVLLRHHAYAGRANPILAPASTRQETAVRVVLAAVETALDTEMVLARMAALHGGEALYAGSSTGNTCRRDLTVREVGTAGRPRVLSTHVNGRAVFYSSSINKDVAIRAYLALKASEQAA